MDLFIIIALFIFWTLFWSFWSVLVWRLRWKVDKNTIKWILIGHSECPKCKTRLGVLDLFPIFSYIFSNWKCRHCWYSISLFYPFIEIFTWLIFIFSYWLCYLYLGYINFADPIFWWNLIFICFFNWVLVLFIIQDIISFHLNDYIWIISALIIIFLKFTGQIWDYYISFVGAVTLFILFYAIYIFSKFYVKLRFWLEDTEGFWGWDVMVAFWLWLLFDIVFKVNGIDFSIINMIMLALYYLVISCILWIIFAIFSYLIFWWKQGKSIPFLPAMVVGFWILLMFGWKIFNLM